MDKETGTKEDTPTEETFTSIDPQTLPEDLQKLYKSMQADYTRKTQDIASRRKEYDDRENQWAERIKTYGSVEQEVQQWRDWYKSLSEKETEKAQTPSTNELSYLDEPDSEGLKKYLADLQTNTSNTVKSLQEEITSLKAALTDTTDRTSRMFNYHAQLNELGTRYKDLDKKELLDYALKTGQPDLEKAYKDLHQDALIEQEVAKRLEEREKELRTRGIKGPGQQVIVRKSSDAPKSFTEATEQILKERAAQGLI